MTARGALEPFVVPLDPKAEEIRSIVEPVIADEGFELVSLVLVLGARRTTLRVFVDTLDPETHISLSDLEGLSYLLGDVLDVEDQHRGLFRGQYNLEVSSPGLDRPLAKRSHFERAVGSRVRVRARGKLAGGGRGHTGTLLSTSAEGIRLSKDGKKESDAVFIPWDELEDAHVVYAFEVAKRPKPKRQKKKAQGKEDRKPGSAG